jgi:hypothetical protein
MTEISGAYPSLLPVSNHDDDDDDDDVGIIKSPATGAES